MNNYILEIAEVCKLPFEDVLKSYKVICLGGKCIYISNYKKIIDCSNECIVIKVENNTLEISGTDLIIKQINKGEILIVGKINGFNCGV